jgi:hypothetical protein
MTTTCLPPAAYYHLNRTNESVKPRFREALPTVCNIPLQIATQSELEAAFKLTFGQQALEEDFNSIDWTSDPSEWKGDARKFADALEMADCFVWSVMHRLFPFQYREMIPALTHALMSWSWRRERPLPYRLSDEDAIHLLNYANYDNMAEWLEEQQ